jgi:hypothetical protein
MWRGGCGSFRAGGAPGGTAGNVLMREGGGRADVVARDLESESCTQSNLCCGGWSSACSFVFYISTTHRRISTLSHIPRTSSTCYCTP